MNKQTPSVSVLMSVYNGAGYLQESIESILNQTFTNFEFIIIDDCSTDNSKNIIIDYASKDERIVFSQNQENLGLTKSLNKGIKIAKGKYVARQDADDVSLPQRLEKQVSVLDSHPAIALVSCDIEVIDSEGNCIGKHHRACESDLVGWYLLFYNHLAGHSQTIFRRELVMNLGAYCESYRYSQDYELWCRLVRVGKILIIPEVLLQQRRHNQSISTAKSSQQHAYALAQAKHNINLLIAQEISLEEVNDMYEFWVGNYWWSHSFPNARKAGNIHTNIRKILAAFINQEITEKLDKQQINSQLRLIIGQQFIFWIHSLSMRSRLKPKIIVSIYGFMWHPLGVLLCWLGVFKKILYKGLNKLKFPAIRRANT
jgi:glycosyltransferase involved in cell wall biosynthesis